MRDNFILNELVDESWSIFYKVTIWTSENVVLVAYSVK